MDSPIVPVMLHHPWKMATFSRRCLERGIAVVVAARALFRPDFDRFRRLSRRCSSFFEALSSISGAVLAMSALGSTL